MGEDTRSSGTGVLSSAGTLGGSLLKLLGVRVSYAMLELADARDAMLRVLLLGVAALGAAALALVSLSAWLVVLFWNVLGAWTLLILFVAHAAAAFLLLLRASRIVDEGQLGMPVTVAELQKDREAIFGGAVGDGEPS
jgi:uncharacterized membrane protein YqjE